MIKKSTAYRIFQIAWVYFLIINIADFRLHTSIDLIPFVHVSEIPFIRYLPFLLAALFIIPVKEMMAVFKEKRNLVTISLILLLLVCGCISSALSVFPETAFGVCKRISFYVAALIFTLAAVRYFEGALDFMAKSFIYSNVLVIAGSLLDFYVPQFHTLLVKHFDRPEAFHSLVRVGGQKIMRPMGFLTDSNLTAFSIALSMMLLLLNHEHIAKIFRYAFYILGSYVFGMLVSRASLLICVISIIVYFIYRLVERRELYLFIGAFIFFQLITPQTYTKLYLLFNKEPASAEISSGRFVIWQAAYTLFKENPVIGAGPGVFFELSQQYLRNILSKEKEINIDFPDRPRYHKIDKLNPHSIFLVMLTETGLIGFSIFMFLIAFLAISFIKQKQFISLLFLLNILFVSSLSNFAPYYKFYLVICVMFFAFSASNMKLSRKREGSFTGVKKILIFKLCCLGDSVFITPAVKSLRMNFPDSKIIYAHAKWIELIIPYVPCINGSILFDNVYSESTFKKTAGTLKFILKVRKEKFDLVLFGHRSNLLSFILKLCGIRYRLGFSGTKYLTHTAKFEKDVPEFLRYLNILTGNGLAVDDSPPELKSLPVDKFKEINGFNPGEKLLGIFPKGGVNPGTFMDIKQWGDPNYFKLIKLINKGYPELNIIVFEGKYDIEKLSLPGELRAVKRTIANELIACCDYFISGDTGSLHIAAALGIPTLSIFGPSDPGVLAPINIPGETCKHIVIWKKPACSPCYTPDTSIDKSNRKYWHGNNFICNTGTHECLKLVTPEEVFEEFKKLIR